MGYFDADEQLYTIDLHNLNVNQAKETLNKELAANGKRFNEILVIHGHKGGTAIRDMVRSYRHSCIEEMDCSDPGNTLFYLK